MQFLEQSTTVTIQLGPFLDEDDGKTAETALTISSTDVNLSKNGAAFDNPNDANAATHDATGWYRKQINATDTNTLGRLIVHVHESGALPVWREFMVVNSNVYDSLINPGTDYLQVDVIQVEGSDATNQIRDSVVDDATQIDASALNTFTAISNLSSLTIDASGHLEVDVVEIEGADPTDTIRDSVVDDATRVDASALNTLSSFTPASTIAAASDVPSAASIIDQQLTDDIPADGTIPTVEQSLYMLYSFMMERAVSGTTVTVKKVDGSTSLFTLTLNDATDPTSITRAT